MFCSKCGKTIHSEDAICPSCGAAIGNNRFGGIPYTSAQFTIAPGQKDFEPQTDYEPQNNYTRTSYTQMPNAAQENGEVDSRTTYRPVYEDAVVPDDIRQQLHEAVKKKQDSAQAEPEAEESEEPAETETFEKSSDESGRPLSASAQERLDEIAETLQPEAEIDLEQFRRRPIETRGRAGISDDVNEYIRKLENGQGRRASRRSAAVYDDYAEPEENPAAEHSTPASGDTQENYVPEEESEETFEDAYDDEPRGRAFGVAQILKVLGALVLVAAIAFGVIKWVGYVRGKQPSAPIEGVSKSLYDDGIALLKSHMEGEYINGMISKYTTDGIISMSAALETDMNAFDALMPETPATNDSMFMNALQTIQNNISSAITMDALAIGSPSATAIEDSEGRWQIVSNSISQLEGAASAAELTGIINGQTITVQTETPEPTQAPPNYATLQKGDESNDVLTLQIRLNQLGYLNDTCDGAFGSKTQTAVKLFQETVGLNPTGIADSDTQAALNDEDAPYAPGAVTPTPAAQQTPEPPAQESMQAPVDDPLENV